MSPPLLVMTPRAECPLQLVFDGPLICGPNRIPSCNLRQVSTGYNLVSSVTVCDRTNRPSPQYDSPLISSLITPIYLLRRIPLVARYRAKIRFAKPLATMVVGALLCSTVLTLLIVLIVYRWMEQRIGRPRNGHVRAHRGSTIEVAK